MHKIRPEDNASPCRLPTDYLELAGIDVRGRPAQLRGQLALSVATSQLLSRQPTEARGGHRLGGGEDMGHLPGCFGRVAVGLTRSFVLHNPACLEQTLVPAIVLALQCISSAPGFKRMRGSL